MDLDIDYLDVRREASRTRWRMKLTALALFACVIMFGDLVAEARPLDDAAIPETARHYEMPQPACASPDNRFTRACDSQALIFNFMDETLCSSAG